MNEVTEFKNYEFGTLRQIDIDDVPWFVGKDVAEILGYANTNEAIADHVDDEDKLNSKTLSSCNLKLGQRGGWLINESGLYSLILSSKLESARRFKRWITSEVLPQIRRTGRYSVPTKAEMPVKDYNYWINLPADSDDYRRLLEQERARIGATEARKRARAQAKWEYKEFHAGSPLLIGDSVQGYTLTDEAVYMADEYLKTTEQTRIVLLYHALVMVDRSPNDFEVQALEEYLYSRKCLPQPSTFARSMRNRMRLWKVKEFEEEED